MYENVVQSTIYTFVCYKRLVNNIFIAYFTVLLYIENNSRTDKCFDSQNMFVKRKINKYIFMNKLINLIVYYIIIRLLQNNTIDRNSTKQLGYSLIV